MNILNIADEIEKERKRQGLTVEALCANAGVERSTYYRWLGYDVSEAVTAYEGNG